MGSTNPPRLGDWGREIEMSATITLDSTVSADAFARVQALAEEVVLRDCDWNGASISVERGDYTSIDCQDEVAGTALLARVYRAIDGE